MTVANSVIGYLGPRNIRAFAIVWNGLLEVRQTRAMFDFYRTLPCRNTPCEEKKCLHLRLSEMMLLGRRGYIIDPELQSMAYTMVDICDDTALKNAKVDTILNDNGVQKGFYYGLVNSNPVPPLRLQYRLFLERQVSEEQLELFQRKLPKR